MNIIDYNYVLTWFDCGSIRAILILLAKYWKQWYLRQKGKINFKKGVWSFLFHSSSPWDELYIVHPISFHLAIALFDWDSRVRMYSILLASRNFLSYWRAYSCIGFTDNLQKIITISCVGIGWLMLAYDARQQLDILAGF